MNYIEIGIEIDSDTDFDFDLVEPACEHIPIPPQAGLNVMLQ